MDIATGSGGGSTTSNTNESTTEFENALGTRETVTSDPKGRATKIFVSVSVPRDWVAQVVKQTKAAAPAGAAGAGGAGGGGGAAAPAAEPTNDEITQAWPAEQKRISDLVAPLVATAMSDPTGASVAQAGEVVVSLIPVALASLPASGGGASGASMGGGAGAGMIGGVLGGGMVKYVGLGGLAVLSLGMMLMMVRKAGRTEAMPSAQEIVGIPPALATGSDLVGEAGESDAAIDGIEVDDSQIKSKKMLEQVSDLIKSNPRDASVLFNRWVSPEV